LEKILKSYTALKVKFEFPETVKYPNLPVRLDFSSVIFPRKGETFCTGIELILSLRLGCTVDIRGGVWIPFKSLKTTSKTTPSKKQKKFIREPLLTETIADLTKEQETEKTLYQQISDGKNYRILQEKLSVGKNDDDSTQFFSVVEKVLLERIKYPKGSYMNLLYKFIANAGIGQMARGLNQKTRYDVSSNSQKTIPPGELVSPLYAG